MSNLVKERETLQEGAVLADIAYTPEARRILNPEALALVARLHRALEPERRKLLEARKRRQESWNQGALPGYVEHADAEEIRSDWKIAPLPEDLMRRRVEITGPISDPKMVINMLSRNSDGLRADCAMLDFEDSMKPSWSNVVAGWKNLIGAVDGTLTHEQAARGSKPAKVYTLDASDLPVIMVRCRGLHLAESNLTVDGEAVSAGLVDLAVSFFHTASTLRTHGKTPKAYVPKVEHYLEARWWNRLLVLLEEELELPASSLRVTLLIETLPAAFQVEEILWELRDHIAALNVGRWDKIFSDIKVLREHPDRVIADRGTIGMQRPWMKNYAESLIRSCHRHGAFAMGGMAAFTPGASAEKREEQVSRVVSDKRWEATLGHDGCWVSHPFFISSALQAFPNDNQLEALPEMERRPDLLPQGGGPFTMAGLRTNIRVGIAYVEGWRRDVGCIAWDDLMEDLATLEISRAQVWQWMRHGTTLECGTTVDRGLVAKIFNEELARIVAEISSTSHDDPALAFVCAAEEAKRIFCEESFRPFLAEASDLASN